MKKSLIALAVLASSGAVMAQSSVTLFGIIDAGVARTSASGTGNTTGLVSGGSSTSRLGFRGTEDLGGGLAASFWLEGQLNNDVGGGASQTTGFDFVRRSTVSLSGNFGEVRLGRNFAPTYLSMIAFDAFGQRGFGAVGTFGPGAANALGTYVRNSNSVAYFLPATMGGFYGTVQYAFGERNSNTTAITNAAGFSTSAANAITDKTGNYLGGRVGFANGPLDVAGSYGQFKDAVRTTGVAGSGFYADSYQVMNLGASYNFGVVKPMLLVQTEKLDGRGVVPDFKFNTYSIGATAPLGAGVLKAQYARYDNKTTGASGNDANQFAIGYQYNLSKRTAVYADVSRLSNKGSAVYSVSNLSSSIGSTAPTAGGNSTGYVVGVKHSF